MTPSMAGTVKDASLPRRSTAAGPLSTIAGAWGSDRNVENAYAHAHDGDGMADGRLAFEPETMSPIIPIATAVLIALFAIGLAYQLIGLL